MWQTTGGERLTEIQSCPAIAGTFKGTFYAMLFAVPLALLERRIVSYFAAPGLRRMIKPVVEVMATVPSVVIGFLMALGRADYCREPLLAFFVSLITDFQPFSRRS